ncbi:26046_t:CDS:2 [Gigaspora rosea]|nr:26046_t:CDS:2 [Gigaspora rosea]
MKAKMEHQHKIAELIAQMKQTKMQNGKEFKLAYLGPLSAIIQQNKERQDNEISEANKFQINQNTINTITEDDRKFQISDMLKIAINQNIMTENDRKYLLDEEKK